MHDAAPADAVIWMFRVHALAIAYGLATVLTAGCVGALFYWLQ